MIIEILTLWIVGGCVLMMGDSVSHTHEGMTNLGFCRKGEGARKKWWMTMGLPLLAFIFFGTFIIMLKGVLV